jgi:hypothetical protein
MEWQPIETAPKDGTWILVYPAYSDTVAMVRWEGKRPPRWQMLTGISIPCAPTRWMPLPPPPPSPTEP